LVGYYKNQVRLGTELVFKKIMFKAALIIMTGAFRVTKLRM